MKGGMGGDANSPSGEDKIKAVPFPVRHVADEDDTVDM